MRDVKTAGWLAVTLGLTGCIEAHPAWQGGTDSGGGSTSTTTDTSETVGSTSTSTTGTSSTTAPSTGPGSTGGSTGSSGTGSTGGSTGGSTTGGLPGDCRPIWAGGSVSLEVPVELADLNSGVFEGDPALDPDGLTLYFSTARGGGVGGTDVWMATRPDPDSAFGSPELVPDVNSAMGDLGFSVSADGLHVFSVGDGASSIDLRTASRGAVGDPFGAWSFLDELNTGENEYDAFTPGDPLRLYWTLTSTPMSKDNLYTATRPAVDQPFGVPQLLDVDDPDADDDSPTLTDDELVIVFSSNRTGSVGDQDLWYATRPSTGDPFTTPVPVPGVNSNDREGESWITPDGCELFFVSDRAGTGGWDLYYTRVLGP